MPADRPAIPADIERAILTEAGHRCAVCGESCPVERAHIVPWRKVKTHCAENLVCLCANCHQRADNENWGQKTLRYYKEHPWILRRQRLDEDRPVRRGVTLKIDDLDLPSFDEKQRRLLLHGLAGFLGIPPESIEIVEVDEGSIIVTVELPDDDAIRLLRAIQSDDPALIELLDSFQSSEAMTDDQRNARGRVLELSKKGHNLFESKDFETACDVFSEALSEFENFCDEALRASVLCNVGYAYSQMGMCRRSIPYYQKALQIEEERGNQKGIAHHLYNLGTCYYDLDDFATARPYLLRARDLYEQLGNEDKVTDVEWYLDRLQDE